MLYFVSCTIFFLLQGCVSLPKPPKPRLCLSNTSTGMMDCLNSGGTKFRVPLTKADKYVCQPAEDFIEVMTYTNAVMDLLKRGYIDKLRIK